MKFFFSFVFFFFSFTIVSNTQNLWESLDGPRGFIIGHLSTDNTGAIYVNSYTTGIFRSTDNGETWESFNQGVSLEPDYFSFEFISSPDGQMYLLKSGELFRLNNNQTAWEVILPPTTISEIDVVAVNPNGDLFISDNDGNVFVSNNMGNSFSSLLTQDQFEGTVGKLYLFNSDQNFIFISNGSTNSLYRFNENNSSVELLRSNIGYFYDFFYDEINNTWLLRESSRLYISIDDGFTWNQIIDTGTPPFLPSYGDFYVHANGDLYISSSNGYLTTTDGGLNWEAQNPFDTPSSLNKPYGIAHTSNDNIFLYGRACSNQKFFRTIDGGENWENISLSFEKLSARSFLKDVNHRLFIKTCQQDNIIYSEDDGDTWSHFTIGSEQLLIDKIAINSEDHFFAIGQNDSLYRSIDNGISWENLTTDTVLEYIERNTPLVIGPFNDLFLISDLGIIKSSDNGNSWEYLDVTSSLGPYPTLVFHPNGNIFSRGNSGGLWRSTDGGFTWGEIPTSIELDEYFDLHINSEGILFITGEDFFNISLYTSNDEGSSFEVSPINDLNPGSSISYYASNLEGNVFCVTFNGVYCTKDNGQSWIEVNTSDIPNDAFINLLYFDKEDYLYVGTQYAGSYKSTESTALPHLIQGTVWQDQNDDCFYDEDSSLNDWVVKVEGENTYYSSTNFNGNFQIEVPEGNYDVSLIPPNDLWTNCFDGYSIEIDETIDSTQVDLSAKPEYLCPYMTVDISSTSPRRCFSNTYTVRYCNSGTVDVENAFVEVTLDPFYEFIDSEIIPSSIQGDIYTFQLGNVNAGDCGYFRINCLVSCESELDQEYCIEAHLYPDSLCLPSLDSLFLASECRKNIDSFDANDKIALINGEESSEVIPTNRFIDYHIRFQNPGPDTVFQIIVEDKLSDYLDPSSLILGASSHEYQFELSDKGTIKFTFDNIMLPGSMNNEVASHGFVKFKIAQKEDLAIGVEIRNSANVYFDSNDPVSTNVSLLTVSQLVSTYKLNYGVRPKITTAPNPFDSYTVFEISGTDQLSFSMQIVDLNGRLIRTETFEGLVYHLQRGQLSTGLYFYKIFDKSGFFIGSGKIVLD